MYVVLDKMCWATVIVVRSFFLYVLLYVNRRGFLIKKIKWNLKLFLQVNLTPLLPSDAIVIWLQTSSVHQTFFNVLLSFLDFETSRDQFPWQCLQKDVYNDVFSATVSTFFCIKISHDWLALLYRNLRWKGLFGKFNNRANAFFKQFFPSSTTITKSRVSTEKVNFSRSLS